MKLIEEPRENVVVLAIHLLIDVIAAHKIDLCEWVCISLPILIKKMVTSVSGRIKAELQKVLDTVK